MAQLGVVYPHKPFLLQMNDGQMAVLLFFIGLVVKREFPAGEFIAPKKIDFPMHGLLGGMSA
ncbi:MAG: Na+/H+ antiporter NhaA [Bacteroidales bacterium]|nr:Na+/H+ antiporter NhaA [Bacteroidales bacterium]